MHSPASPRSRCRDGIDVALLARRPRGSMLGPKAVGEAEKSGRLFAIFRQRLGDSQPFEGQQNGARMRDRAGRRQSSRAARPTQPRPSSAGDTDEPEHTQATVISPMGWLPLCASRLLTRFLTGSLVRVGTRWYWMG